MPKTKNNNKQLSLLDLDPPAGQPTERQKLYWETWNKPVFERLVREFQDEYQEAPILRKRLQERFIDLYMTHPKNAYLVDMGTGQLLQDELLLRQVWGMDISNFSAERRRHLSTQLVALLDGKISAQDWKPEIAQRLGYVSSRQEDLLQALQESGLEYSLERDGFKGRIWIFGPPQRVKEFFKHGWEAGFLR
ncbi:MAG: hypothetical protein ACQEQX_09890 [Thermodesulfobacteriota bacterium]